MGVRHAIGGMIFTAALAFAAPALAQDAAPDIVQPIVRSLPIDEQAAAEKMFCRQIGTRTPAQQYCTWRVYGRNSFAEIWAAVVTQAGGRWLVAGGARPAAAKDVLVRSGTADNGKLVTLEACLRANGAVGQAGRTAFCNQR